MGLFKDILGGIGELAENIIELIVLAIPALVKAAVWAVKSVIEWANDITSWLNSKLKEFLNIGRERSDLEFGVAKGNAFADFVRLNQQKGNYTEISLDDLNAMDKGVINFAMDKKGKSVDTQLVRSKEGLSDTANERFEGKSYVRIAV